LQSYRDRKNWNFIFPHPFQDIIFQQHNEDLHEAHCLLSRLEGHKQPVFTVFPERHEYATGDLFSSHEDEYGHTIWQFRCRADDMQCFLGNEKFYPTDMERIVGNHPDIDAVLYVGTRRPRGALLIQLHKSAAANDKLMESLWALIEEANEPLSNTAKISRDMILFTDEHIPMKKTSKGTIERWASIRLYEQKLNTLYGQVLEES
jgi:acyl-CoA synthetase (AMP-forming)/AMP-acid ligase II